MVTSSDWVEDGTIYFEHEDPTVFELIPEVSRRKIKAGSAPFSRYRLLDRITYSDGVEIVETMNQVTVEHSINSQFFVVTDEYENRLDKIAYKFYHNTRLWWVIAYASNLLDPFNVPIGTRLRIPPYATAISDEVI